MSTLETVLGSVSYTREYSRGATLVLLHGMAVTSTMWKVQVADLARRNDVLTLDLPGHGKSQPLEGPTTVDSVADAVLEVLDHEEVSSATVCGHSYGGMVAQILAGKYPRRVRSLLLAESSLGIRTTPIERLASGATNWMMGRLSMQTLARASARSYGATTASRDYLLTTMPQMHRSSFGYLWKGLQSFDGPPWLRRIDCPTFVATGGLNRRTHKQARRMASILGGELINIEGASHLLNIDQPSAFNQLLRTALPDA